MTYDAIFKRRAVRKYNETPVEQNVLDELNKLLKETKQIDGQEARFEINTSKEVKGPAPYYVSSFCREGDASYANVGYILQKADLFVQSKGLGSVYLAGKKPKTKLKTFCIVLAFGNSDVPFRAKMDFERLSVSEISTEDNPIAQAARLAPSAWNSQPWKLSFEDGKVIIDYHGRGAFKLFFRNKLNMIDMGIVTRHVEESLLKEGKKVTSIVPENIGKGFRMTVSFE